MGRGGWLLLAAVGRGGWLLLAAVGRGGWLLLAAVGRGGWLLMQSHFVIGTVPKLSTPSCAEMLSP